MDVIEFGKRVKAARKKKKLTQVQLADIIGKKEATIRKYENGTIEAPWNVIEDIATALDVSPFDLTVDVDQLRSDVKLQDEIEKVFGKKGLQLLNDFDLLNSVGQDKACEYLSDLTLNPKYKKEPSSAATDNGSDKIHNENTKK